MGKNSRAFVGASIFVLCIEVERECEPLVLFQLVNCHTNWEFTHTYLRR